MKLGTIEGHDGLAIGSDPRKMTVAQLADLGHEKKSLSRVIRERCLDCCAGNPEEVRKCVSTKCANWPYRMGGKSPFSTRTGNPNAFRPAGYVPDGQTSL